MDWSSLNEGGCAFIKAPYEPDPAKAQLIENLMNTKYILCFAGFSKTEFDIYNMKKNIRRATFSILMTAKELGCKKIAIPLL